VKLNIKAQLKLLEPEAKSDALIRLLCIAAKLLATKILKPIKDSLICLLYLIYQR